MVEEVEVDTEDRVAVDLAHGPGGDAPAGEVEGHVPPVVAPHAGGQADLADDLAEPMQRLLGVLPGGQGDRWEQLHACTLRSRALLTLPAIDRLALGVPARQPCRGEPDGPARVRAGEETLLCGDPFDQATNLLTGLDEATYWSLPPLSR